jgi:hypothetical protein
MSEDLKQRIKEFNEIKYPKDNETRIIFTTLKPDIPVMGSFDEDGNQTWGVTTALKYK